MIEQTFSHYRITKKLGAGGMGEVYLAEDTTLNRCIALKLLPAKYTQNEERLRRFKQEARAASTLNHPNILTIHEVGEAQGRHFIATEFIDGDTLRERLKPPGTLKTSETLAIAAQVASALAAAHEAGIIHRDIKPENVMLRRDGYVKVLDFGLAKLTEKAASQPADSDAPTRPLAHTQTGAIVGTTQYMSPEQARGLTLDARTDVWSLGCVLYEMVAGRAPFAGETVTDMLVAIVERDPPPLKHLAPEQIPNELDWIITKTLRKNPDERYRTSKELFVDLQRLRQKLEIEAHLERSAPPEASGEAVKANISKHPTAKHPGHLRRILATRHTAVYAAIFITLVLGALAYLWRWRQTSAAPQAQIKSLAVLPLKSLDASENYLGLGIADALIRRISQTGVLTVRPTSAVRRYLNEDTDALTAARQLNADAVLEGSVQRDNDRLRVSVNLLRTSDGVSLWSDNFDMLMTDIFTIQDTVSQQVASRLRLQLDPSHQARFKKRYTANAEAYEYFLKGNYSFDKRELLATADLEVAEAMFKKAIEIDPKYALARARLAYCYAWKALFTDVENPSWIEQSREEIKRAESLDPELPQISEVRYEITWSKYGNFNISVAVRELRRGQQFDANFGHQSLGVLAYHLGLEDFALKELQRAIEIDPMSENIKNNLVEANELLGKYDEAINDEKKFFNDLGPTLALIWANRLNEAETDIAESLAKEPSNARMQSAHVRLLALRGKFNEAEALIPAISAKAVNTRSYHHVTYDFACAYSLEGKSKEAVEWLRKTVEYGMPNYPLFDRDPHLDRIRHEPVFIQFMQELHPRWDQYRREFA